MRLFILAAGTGTRLLPLTKNTPKSLLDLGDGTNLLERQIANAGEVSELKEVVVITGYKTEQIEAKIRGLDNNLKVTTLFNPFFDISNNLLSLWCANHLMEDDFVITNGDNIYKESVIINFISEYKNQDGIHLTIDKKDIYDDDDMKVSFNNKGFISRVHKDIETSEAESESVGLVLVKGKKYRDLFKSKLIELSKLPAYRNKFWLEVFNSMIEDGVTVDKYEIDKDDWREMDFHPDMTIIKEAMKNRLI
ncbi:MAG: sugar phosphate nucleotidyltransferase [Rhodothermaceae bacterium]